MAVLTVMAVLTEELAAHKTSLKIVSSEDWI
jgi:hypothetical protein